MTRPLIILLVVFAIGAVFFGYNAYNKPHTNVAQSQASETLLASEIFVAFDTNEQAAMAIFSDRVIQLEGELLRKDLSNEKEPQILLKGNGEEGFVRCGFKPTELTKVLALTDSSTVKIKGICMGFNGSEELDLLDSKDVVLSNCIIIN
jgi:hypothetical protein